MRLKKLLKELTKIYKEHGDMNVGIFIKDDINIGITKYRLDYSRAGNIDFGDEIEYLPQQLLIEIIESIQL